MTARRTRSRILRLSLIALGAAGFLLATPGSAAAGSRHHRRHHDGHHRGHDHGHHRGHDHGHHRGHDHGHHRGHDRHAVRVFHHGPSCGYRGSFIRVQHHRERHYCAPCDRDFDSQHHLHGHIRQVHHIPAWRLPFSIVNSTLGFVFYGELY